MRLLDVARRGANLKSVSRGGGGFGSWRTYGVAGFDWNREAGRRYDNSIVFAAITFAINALTEVDILVERPKGDGGFEEVPDHPAAVLLRAPNDWYDGQTWISGCVISELAGRGGMSYSYKHRSSGGRLVALEYLPHFAVSPWVKPGSASFLDAYRISVQGGLLEVDPKNMLAQRYGPMNPQAPQVGIGPLEAVLQQIVTDTQAANYTGSLLRNVGVTPHLISPKEIEGVEVEFGEAEMIQIKAKWEEHITGDNRGKPLVMPLPVNVENLSFSPSDMNLEAIHNVSEERICAALGIPPIVLHLGTGLQHSNNRASAEAAFLQAARSFVLPYMRRKAAQLTWDLIPELGQPGERIRFRTEAIDALQADETEEADRDETACGGPWMTVNEIRKKRGLPPIDGGDVIRSKSQKEDRPKGKELKDDEKDTKDQ